MMQNLANQTLANQTLLTRRHFFGGCGLSIGSMALGSLLMRSDGIGHAAAPTSANTSAHLGANPFAPRPGHFPARAKSVIFLFMAGGPSSLDLFDFKPKLQVMNGQVIPPSYVANKRFAFISQQAKLLGTPRKFARHGQSGALVSNLLPHLTTVADDLCLIKSMKTDVFNHGPAKCFMNTGSERFGRPSMGAWISYGIGSEALDLPAFVVLNSGPRGPRGGTPLYGSGFLPTTHQGVPLRATGEPILDLTSPQGVTMPRQRAAVDTINALNALRHAETGDSEITTRMAAYEMACKMQTSAPELMDLSHESKATLDLYGVDPARPSYARNCLLARRLVERGVRFVQLYHTDWDHHGGSGLDLTTGIERTCRETDQASAALVADLKARGLLDDTLVIWGGEFGRTPMGEDRGTLGRDHHVEAFTMWLAGGGVKAGVTIGETDDLGYYVTRDLVHVHDLQATVLHLLGLDHLRLTYRFQGRNFRLTDVAGKVVHSIIA